MSHNEKGATSVNSPMLSGWAYLRVLGLVLLYGGFPLAAFWLIAYW